MMIDEKETTNGHICVLNCSMGPTTDEHINNSDKGGLLLDGSSSGVSFGEGTSADRLRMYERRKRRKKSNSDEITNTEFKNKIEAGECSAFHKYIHRLTFNACPVEISECSLKHSNNIGVQSLNGHEDGCTSAIKESVNNVEISDNQIHNSDREITHVMSNGLIKQSEGYTISDLCEHSFSDILNSDKFSELCGLLMKNFGVVNVDRILDVNAIQSKMKTGTYENSPMLYLKDLQQVWTKLQQVGNEMVTLAKTLSDNSRAHYEQFVRNPSATASNCKGCSQKANVKNCLVCDSCEEIYHLSCTDLIGTQIPVKSWYCASCVSNGIGSPHDNCAVCEKLKTVTPTPLVNKLLTTNQPPNGLEPEQDTHNGPEICYICKTEVNNGDNYRTCGHSLCSHKFYHYKCLTNKQLGVCGPCWYCPSCLCRRCLVDKDDDQIVLCDACDQAYHTYCTTPQLNGIPDGNWYCGKCDRELKRIRTMKRVYENIQKKVKIEDGLEDNEAVSVVVEKEVVNSTSGGLEMLVTAAKTLSHEETVDLDTLRNII